MKRHVGAALHRQAPFRPKQTAIVLAVITALSALAIPAMAQSVTISRMTIGSNTTVSGQYSTDGSTPMNLTVIGTFSASNGSDAVLAINSGTLGTVTNSGALNGGSFGIIAMGPSER